MKQGEVFIRFSDFRKNVPYHLVIKNINHYDKFYYEMYLKYEAFIPTSKGLKAITVIFPKWKFKRAYVAYPVHQRVGIGDEMVFIEVYKRKRGVIEITKIDTWIKAKQDIYTTQ